MNARPIQSQVPITHGEWLTPLSGHWVERACDALSHDNAAVRVVVAGLRGSTPRETGACMLVDAQRIIGTIGGGRLEWEAVVAARALLTQSALLPSVRVQEWILGPQLNQCCGGRVELWFERLTRSDLPWLRDAALRLRADTPVRISTVFDGVNARREFSASPAVTQLLRGQGAAVTLVEALQPARPPLWIFGAGHVGQALLRLLSDLDVFDVTWIDSRPELLPPDLPRHVTALCVPAPATLLATAAPGTRFVVMTHDHTLDYRLCRQILERGDCGGLGLIGSDSKAARFRSRLLRDGVGPDALATLTCPIGVEGIDSKLPAVIAIAILAQLLQAQSVRAAGQPVPEGCDGNCDSCGRRGGGA